jgi:hypothetical protein
MIAARIVGGTGITAGDNGSQVKTVRRHAAPKVSGAFSVSITYA